MRNTGEPEVCDPQIRKPSSSLELPSMSKKAGTRCRRPSYERFSEGCSSPSMRLAEHLARRFALGGSNVCLVGENPTCSAPALEGCEDILSYDCGHARTK